MRGGPRAGEMGGGFTGSPTSSRIRLIDALSVTKAMRVIDAAQ